MISTTCEGADYDLFIPGLATSLPQRPDSTLHVLYRSGLTKVGSVDVRALLFDAVGPIGGFVKSFRYLEFDLFLSR